MLLASARAFCNSSTGVKDVVLEMEEVDADGRSISDVCGFSVLGLKRIMMS